MNTDYNEYRKVLVEKADEIKENYAEVKEEVKTLGDKLLQFEQKGISNLESIDGQRDFEIKGFSEFLRTGETKSMSITTESSGGYTHVPKLSNKIIAAVGEINPLFNEVNTEIISSNEFQQIFTTSRSATARSAESGTRNETNTANFERSSINLFDLYAVPQITNELLDSSDFAIDKWLVNDVRESFNETLSTEFVSGSSNECIGLLNSMSPNSLVSSPVLPWGSIRYLTPTNSPQSINYPDLLRLVSALPLRYKVPGNAKFFMSTGAIETVRGLLDQNDLPIWRQDFGVAGAPMVLLGYPVVEVPQLESTGYEVLFGDMKQTYTFVTHSRGIRMLVDQITTKGMTKFYTSMQCGGGVMDSRGMVALAS